MGMPAITSPKPGSKLTGHSVTITWSANGEAATDWWLSVGDRPHRWNIHNEDEGASEHADITDIPTDGGYIYARLRYKTKDSPFWERTMLVRFECDG